MSEKDLTPAQRRALVILMAEAREVPNAYLTKVRKFDLDRPDRDRLVEYGLITVNRKRTGGPLSMELTEKGWNRAVAELGSDMPVRAGSYGAVLYAVLEKLGQYVDRAKISPQDIFFAVPEDVEARIRKAYGELAPRAGDYVMLARLRKVLADIPRADLDATLVRLVQAPDVLIVPESNQKALSAEERAGAVTIGNQQRHLISIGS